MSSNDAITDRLLTAKQAGDYLGYAEGTIRNKVGRDEIPHVRLGRAVRFRKSELDRWIEEETARANKSAA